MPRLEYMTKGVKRHQARVGGGSRTRLPITPSLLRELRKVWSQTRIDRDTKMLWAACCLCFFGFLRAGELTVPSDSAFDQSIHLCLSDVAAVDNKREPSMLRVYIKQSKNDPFRKGVAIFIGRTGSAAGLSLQQRLLSGPSFHLRRRAPTNAVPVRGESEGWAGVSRSGPVQVLRSQFPHRSRHDGCKEGDGRLYHQDTRTMGKSGIPTVCTVTTRTAGRLF